MADSTKSETDVPYLGLLASAVITLIAGLVIHSFIIGIYVNDWCKGRSLTAVDHIVTSICISRICAQCDFFLYLIVDTFSLSIQNSQIYLVIIDAAYTFFAYANIWLTALLSIALHLKISNPQTRLFLYMSRMLVQRAVHFIFALILLSAFSLISLWMPITSMAEGETYNITMDAVFTNCNINSFIYIYTIGTFFPLLLCCISSVLLFTSLYHHIISMKMSSNLTINLETYYSVMKFVSFTFIYNTIYFISHLVSAFYYCFYWASLEWVYIFLGFFPTLHSSYLIYRTAKLRNRISKFLQNLIEKKRRHRNCKVSFHCTLVNCMKSFGQDCENGNVFFPHVYSSSGKDFHSFFSEASCSCGKPFMLCFTTKTL